MKKNSEQNKEKLINDVFLELNNYIDRLEILSELYNDFLSKEYNKKEDLEIAKLKMELIKKELMLINYLISKEIERILI